MKAADYARLVLLAAIWGGAFIFMRVAAPVLVPLLPFWVPAAAPSAFRSWREQCS